MGSKKSRNDLCHCGSGKKSKKCHLYSPENKNSSLRKDIRVMPILKMEKFLMLGKNGEKQNKLFQIRFETDGSFYLDFPYFEDANGIVSEVILNPGITYPIDVSLSQNGKATSHLVKYSHHTDGEAHFSQDGKVRTEIRKKSNPLKDINGHMFTIMLQGFDAFHEAKKQKDKVGSLEKGVLCYDLSNADIPVEGIKFIGWWYHRKNIGFVPNKNASKENPIITMKTAGRDVNGFALSSSYWPEHILFLSCEQVPLIDKNGKPCLTFIGGFDDAVTAFNNNISTSMLALSYPCDNPEELAKKIGSIDFLDKRESKIFIR